MEGYEPLLAAFRVADLQPVRSGVIEPQARGFRAAQAGRRDQPDQVMEGHGGDGAGGRQLQRRIHDLADLLQRQEPRRRAVIPLATECIAVGHLVAFVLGMQVGCQPADEVQPLLFLCGDADCDAQSRQVSTRTHRSPRASACRAKLASNRSCSRKARPVARLNVA